MRWVPVRLVCGAVLAGIGAGIAGALLLWVLFGAQWVATGAIEDARHLGDTGVPVWRVVTVPIVVGLVVGACWWQLRTRAKLVRLESAVHDENARMPLAPTAADGALQVVAVGSGASVGREAAPRALAAAIAERIAKWVGLHDKHRGVLVGCAAAAGLAAVYNVPVTGVLYAIEVIGLAFSLETVITAAIASAVGTVVAWPVVGMGPSYGYPTVHLHTVDVVIGLVLIPLGWLVGLAFAAMSNWAHRHRSPAGPRLMLTVPAAMGLVGVLAIWFPTLTGNGKAELQELFTGAAPAWGTVLMLLLLKPIVTSLSVRAAIAGGQLSPALATGGSLGALIAVLSGHGASVPIAVIVGAAAVLAITQDAPAMAAAFAIELTHPGWRVSLLVAVAAAAMYALRTLPISRRVRG